MQKEDHSIDTTFDLCPFSLGIRFKERALEGEKADAFIAPVLKVTVSEFLQGK
jgi:hypothetical protein